MNKRGIGGVAIILALIVIVGVGYFAVKSLTPSTDEAERVDVESVQGLDANSRIAKSHTIEITSDGFNPSSLDINVGDKVIFVNMDSEEHWPASAMHPTHKSYPGSNINKCGTDEAGEIFDACHGLEEGESYEFVFMESGEWGYHDHLIVSRYGKIVVN